MGHPANNCNFWRSNFSDVINNSVSGQDVVQTLTCRDELIILCLMGYYIASGFVFLV